MIRVVWKYELQLNKNTVSMPKGTQLLTAQLQAGMPFISLWALVDPQETEFVDREIWVIGTGHKYTFPGEMLYINTVQDGQGLVWHAFEVTQ